MEIEYFLLIQNLLKQSEYFDEEFLEKVNNKYYTPTEFNNALNELSTKKQNLYMHSNISSLSYHHLEFRTYPISDMKIKPKIIGISESRLQKSKQHITNISLPNYVYEHTPTESSKGGTLLYLDKNLKYKLRKDLNIYQKGMIESTLVKIINKNEKNMVAGCIYKHPKQTIPDFLDNHLLPLLEKLSNEKKQILIMGDFNINLLNYDDKNTANFLDTMFSYSYLSFINTPTRVTGHSKTLIDNIFYNKPMLNITAGNISSVISDLIQFLIEPSSTNAKLEQTCKLQQCYKNFDKTKFKNDLCKISWKEHCSNPDSNVALEHFLQIINKLQDKHAPYAMSKSHSSFTSKPWITTAIANSIKSKKQDSKKIL